MEYIAVAKNIRITPRKVRLVADAVRKKKNINPVLSYLSSAPQRASIPLRKTIQAAMASAANNFKVKREDLTIDNIIISEGSSLKRHHFAARGRIRPYKKRTSHIRVVLTDNVKSEAQNSKSETNSNETKVKNVKTKEKGGAIVER